MGWRQSCGLRLHEPTVAFTERRCVELIGRCMEAMMRSNADEFFKTFDERDLIFLFQQRMTAGATNNFCNF
jgi:hypothetical protein